MSSTIEPARWRRGSPQTSNGGAQRPSDSARRLRLPLMLGAAVTILGMTAFEVRLRFLWELWMTDALRSVGLLVLPISVWLALRRWRWTDWESGGSWWGLLPIVVSVAIGLLEGDARIEMVGVRTNIFPIGLLVCTYLMGAVILLGGRPALHRVGFPLALTLLINPCPGVVEKWLDLPLQQVSAQAARAFADVLGVPLTGDLLHLMFTPEHGVFIAPGCDGLRGAVTIAFMALVAGHLYRLRPMVHVGYVLAGIAAAYLLNLARLCVVVAYTAFATHAAPSFYAFGERFDYLAGGGLFAFFVMQFLNWPRRHPTLCTSDSSY